MSARQAAYGVATERTPRRTIRGGVIIGPGQKQVCLSGLEGSRGHSERGKALAHAYTYTHMHRYIR